MCIPFGFFGRSHKSSFLKKYIMVSGFFLLRVNPIWKSFCAQGSKQEVIKVVSHFHTKCQSRELTQDY